MASIGVKEDENWDLSWVGSDYRGACCGCDQQRALQVRDSLGFLQQFDGLLSAALVYVQQAELQQGVGHQVQVKPNVLLTAEGKGIPGVSSISDFRMEKKKSIYFLTMHT